MTRTSRTKTIKFIQKALYTVPFYDTFIENTYKINNNLYVITKYGKTIPISRFTANFFRNHGVDGWFCQVINKKTRWT